ncbi:MAG: CstA-like transporter-associated (seleno)protein [Candidatus Nitrotoga sp.]|nr:CstA-like transporter-associated (seleno)protein [Candidatus Nitrotoga sp.]
MGTGLIEKSVSESFSVVSDSSLPVFETGRDINRCVAQSGTLTANEEVCVKPFQLLSYVWRVIRELSGDDAYERYIAQHTTSSPDITPLARKDFYLYQQRKKWSGIQRCC